MSALDRSSLRGLGLSNTVNSEAVSILPLPSLPIFCGAHDQELQLFVEPRSLNRSDVLAQAGKINDLLRDTDVSYLSLRADTIPPLHSFLEPLDLYVKVLHCNPKAFECIVPGDQQTRKVVPEEAPQGPVASEEKLRTTAVEGQTKQISKYPAAVKSKARKGKILTTKVFDRKMKSIMKTLKEELDHTKSPQKKDLDNLRKDVTTMTSSFNILVEEVRNLKEGRKRKRSSSSSSSPLRGITSSSTDLEFKEVEKSENGEEPDRCAGKSRRTSIGKEINPSAYEAVPVQALDSDSIEFLEQMQMLQVFEWSDKNEPDEPKKPVLPKDYVDMTDPKDKKAFSLEVYQFKKAMKKYQRERKPSCVTIAHVNSNNDGIDDADDDDGDYSGGKQRLQAVAAGEGALLGAGSVCRCK